MADTQETKEKILLCCGNAHGVENVEDQLGVTQAGVEPQFYTVVSGIRFLKLLNSSMVMPMLIWVFLKQTSR